MSLTILSNTSFTRPETLRELIKAYTHLIFVQPYLRFCGDCGDIVYNDALYEGWTGQKNSEHHLPIVQFSPNDQRRIY